MSKTLRPRKFSFGKYSCTSVNEKADVKPAFINIFQCKRSILALTSCLGFLLALNRRLFVVLSLANLSNNAVLCARSLELLESVLKRLILANAYFCH